MCQIFNIQLLSFVPDTYIVSDTYIVPALVQVVISTSLGLRFVISLVNK